jgi:alpha-galactosidase
MAFSTWNHFAGDINDALVREIADAMAANGLRDAGYRFLNIDDGWAAGRAPNGTIFPDPAKFPYGMKALATYVRAQGLQLGIYTARGSRTCLGRPGSNGYEALDAQTYADWGIGFVKEDSVSGAAEPPR